jgi:hypothetical protein
MDITPVADVCYVFVVIGSWMSHADRCGIFAFLLFDISVLS